jgi:hypothetical protein
VTSCGKELRDTGSLEASLSQTKGCAKPGATGTNNDGIVFVVLQLLGTGRDFRRVRQRTITGYFDDTCGEASFARSGWLAMIRAGENGKMN